VPVISVGNVTWGGNGKTPMAIFLARLAHAHGLRPLVLTRGYGGDEDELLCRQLAGIAGVGSGAQRSAIAAHMLSTARGNARPQLPRESRCMELGGVSSRGSTSHTSHRPQTSHTYAYDLVILDDGHQHRKLVRDTKILMINCLDTSILRSSSHPPPALPSPVTGPGAQRRLELGGQLLPRGTLRESLATALAKADVIVVHNSDFLPPSQLSELCDAITTACRTSPHDQAHQLPPIIRTCTQVSAIRSLLPILHHVSLPGGTGGAAEVSEAAVGGGGMGGGLEGGGGRARGTEGGGVDSVWGQSIPPYPQGGKQGGLWSHIRHTHNGHTPLESTNGRERGGGGGSGVSVGSNVGGKVVVGVAALANPAAFFLKLQSLGVQRLFERPFPDHHAFSHNELAQLVREQCALNLPTDAPHAHTRDSSTRTLAVTIVTTDKVKNIRREMEVDSR
jgi:tetraacyldisaccharide-1-P 4'-kinase